MRGAVAGMLTTWGADILLSNHESMFLHGVAYGFIRVARWLYR